MLCLSDKLLVDAALKASPQMLSDYNFTNLWMWDPLRNYQLLEREGFLLIQFGDIFLYPLGKGSPVPLIQKLIQENRPFRMRAIPEEALKELAFLSPHIFPEENRFDYLYNFDDLVNLPGNAYQAKRNLIHQFERDYDYKFEEINESNLPQVVEAEEKWYQESSEKNIDFEHEGALRALYHFSPLGIRGGALFIENKVVAYSLAEYIHPEVLLIHEEKAFSEHHGAYQMINQQMLKHLPHVLLVNREEDLGKENLHKVKESYHPVKLLKKFQILIATFLLFFSLLHAEEKEEPPPIGNFSLPSSQQPTGLFAFGGNIVDPGEIQWSFFADDFEGSKKRLSDLIPSLLFGINETLSVLFTVPVTPEFRNGCNRSRGLEDLFVQLEWAFYNHKNYCYQDQATLVANVTLPTGSPHKNPTTGFGAPALFLGMTYYRTYVDWLFFTSNGALLPFSDHRTRFGDQFLYQFGASRTIPSPDGWLYALMFEIDGQYSKKNRIRGRTDHNSGGNVIYAVPSFWASSKYFLIQFGATLPINQNLFGNQRKFDWGAAINIAWSFY